MVRLKRFELLTHGLEGRCSILLSYRRILIRPPKKSGAGDGNRTHAASLEGWNSTIELHPHMADYGVVSTTLVYNSTIKTNCQILFALFFKKLRKNFYYFLFTQKTDKKTVFFLYLQKPLFISLLFFLNFGKIFLLFYIYFFYPITKKRKPERNKSTQR